MPRPIQFETVLTRARIVEELEAIEAGVENDRISDEAENRLRELRLAVTRLPLDVKPQ